MLARQYRKAGFNRLERIIESRKSHGVQQQRSLLHQTKKARSIQIGNDAHIGIKVNLLGIECLAQTPRKQYVHRGVAATEKHQATITASPQSASKPSPPSSAPARLQSLCNASPDMVVK